MQPQGIRVRFVLAYARMRALIPTAGSFIETHVIESDGATSRSGDNHLVGENGDAEGMLYVWRMVYEREVGRGVTAFQRVSRKGE